MVGPQAEHLAIERKGDGISLRWYGVVGIESATLKATGAEPRIEFLSIGDPGIWDMMLLIADMLWFANCVIVW